VAALRRHRAKQSETRLLLGPEWNEGGFVFPSSGGVPQDGSHLLYGQFHPLLKRLGLPLIRFHDLRHTAATLLLGQGIHPKIVSEMLGHSTIAITLDLYSHVTPTMQRDAARAMNDLLARSRPPAFAVARHRARPKLRT
jgi:integrase